MFRTAAVLLAACLALSGCTLLPGAKDSCQVGCAAKAFVSSADYATLVVEIDYPSGYEPNPESVSTLKAALQDISGRDAAHVQIQQKAQIPAEAGKRYSFAEIEALEAKHRETHTSGDTASLYIMFVAGGSESDSDNGKVLGAAYRGTSIVIFKGNIRDSTTANPGPLATKPAENLVERAVLVHEFGHAAGLVNLGTDMVRDREDKVNDPAKRGHSTNKASVMYYAVESSASLQLFCQLGIQNCSIPYQFDADDKADLRALRDG